MEAEEADQLRAMEIQSIKGGLGGRTEEHGFGRCSMAKPLYPKNPKKPLTTFVLGAASQ